MKKVGDSTKREAKFNRDWTKGSVSKNLLSLSWPVVIGSTLTHIGPTIDMIWVGKLGSVSMAGVGVAGMLVQLLDAFKMGLDMGTRALVARYFGAGDSRRASFMALQGYVVTIGFAAIVGMLGVILAEPILRMLGLAPEVVAQGTPYLRIQFIGILTQGLVRQNEGVMMASGDTLNPMRVAIIFRLFHAAICPFLVFGWWIFPRLETSGAAYAGIISTCLGATLGLWLLISGRTRLRLSFREFRPDANTIWRIVKIGVPASITSIERNLGQILMTWFVVPFGTIAVAAHTVIQRVEQFLTIPGTAIGQASGVLAAQNLGAKQPERAEKSGWVGAFLCTAIIVVGSLVLWLWGKNIISVFNNEPDVLEVGYAFVTIQIIGYLVLGYTSVLQWILIGVGDTLPTMAVVLLGIFGVQVPLAFFLSRFTSLGVYGTRWAMVIGLVVMAVSYVIYFRLGRWKRKKV